MLYSKIKFGESKTTSLADCCDPQNFLSKTELRGLFAPGTAYHRGSNENVSLPTRGLASRLPRPSRPVQFNPSIHGTSLFRALASLKICIHSLFSALLHPRVPNILLHSILPTDLFVLGSLNEWQGYEQDTKRITGQEKFIDFWWWNLNERKHLEYLATGEKIIVNELN